MKQKILETLFKKLGVCNRVFLKTSSEEEALKSICKYLVEELDFGLVWVGVPDYEKGLVKPLFWEGHEEDYLSEIEILLDPKSDEGKDLAATSIGEGKIAFGERSLKREYLSGVCIPLFVKGKLKYVLNIYAKEANFFSEELSPFLNILKENLEYALERIEEEIYSKMFRIALEESDLFIFITDAEGTIKYLNPYMVFALGYTEEDLLERKVNLLLPHLTFESSLESVFEKNLVFSGIHNFRKKDGGLIPSTLKVIPFLYDNDNLYYLFVGRDISLEKDLLEQLEHIRRYDFLTGLYTYKELAERAKELFEKRENLILLANLDLYNFSLINELYGMDIGDKLLKLFSERLKEKFDKIALLARVASDEFLILFYNLKGWDELMEKVEELLSLFKDPFIIEEEHIMVKYHIGFSVAPRDGNNLEEIYRKANFALFYTKKGDPNSYLFYDANLDKVKKRELHAERLIREAIEKNYFHFYYQPYFYTSVCQLAGAEALVRILLPDGEVISPAFFIEALEKSLHRRTFEIWAMKTIIDQINTWKIPLSLNLYATTFLDEQFWLEVKESIKKLKFPLILEITERGLIQDPQKTYEIIKFLKEETPLIKIAIDDFGTGYSNFEYLLGLPFDILKIDISFVKFMDKDAKKRGIVKSIIDITHILKAKSLAEGVETKEIAEILDIMNCDYVQGFYFDKPLAKEEFEKKYLLFT